jgi:hypothetical protein
VQVSWTDPATLKRQKYLATILWLFCSSTSFDVALLELAPSPALTNEDAWQPNESTTCSLVAEGGLDAEPYPTQSSELPSPMVTGSFMTAEPEAACEASSSSSLHALSDLAHTGRLSETQEMLTDVSSQGVQATSPLLELCYDIW